MLEAARLQDKITHTEQRTGLIGGMIVGALIGAALVAGTIATVLTGGLALAPILLIVGSVATGAAIGGGVFRFLGEMSTVPKGFINKAATTVFINSFATPAARACVDTALCSDHTLKLIATGSSTVFIEGFPAARVGDIGECSFKIGTGSPDVFFGGDMGACANVKITPEVEEWLVNLNHALGIIGGLCLLGPLYGLRVAIASIIGGEIGSRVGGEIGQHYGGRWGGFAGSILGGIIGGGLPLRPGARSFINRLEIEPGTIGTTGGNIRLKQVPPAMQDKILYGERVPNPNSPGGMSNRIIGGHSSEIKTNPNYAHEVISTNADGTTNVKFITQFPDGNLSNIKSSTLAPDSWTNTDVINVTNQTASTTTVATRARDGATLHRQTTNGVEWEVIKDSAGNVTSSYPTGGKPTTNF
ncbi:MAG: EndoU domain-containing protein [Pyrinomonadaceae bacterium]|nr:EndoU domain-containing protein [Pyrinomonadaceae bacterium]